MAGRFRKYIIDYELEQKVAGPYFPILLVTTSLCYALTYAGINMCVRKAGH